jgi:hypothetical protein
MMASIAYRMALPFALFLGVGEVVVNWGNWGFWAFWVVDYIAVVLLLWGWNATRQRQPGAMSRLTGAWGFTCAMFYMGFFVHLETVQQSGPGLIDDPALTRIIGVLFVLTIVGFTASLVAAGGQARRSDVRPLPDNA